MNKVYACIDGLANTDAVIDWGAWAALRLGAPLEFLHVLERHPERTDVQDLSGAIGLGAQEQLLQALSDQDERRSKLAREAGRGLLATARERAAAAGVTDLDARLRHGEFVETVCEMQPDAQLFVLGEHHHASGTSKVHLDHHVEKVIRSVTRPVLVATTAGFDAPRRAVLAFDGSPGARRNVEHAARSPLLRGLPVLVAMAGGDTASARRQLEEALRVLQAAGIEAEMELAGGEPETVLPALVQRQAPALLVIGAYGHSRLRQLLLGSTTSTLLRVSDVPVLVLR
ncbi:MAG TPA: universal stress protein [Ramlibacter sp.]|nr:universal stress protein [Ramlibacter sp.]